MWKCKANVSQLPIEMNALNKSTNMDIVCLRGDKNAFFLVSQKKLLLFLYEKNLFSNFVLDVFQLALLGFSLPETSRLGSCY